MPWAAMPGRADGGSWTMSFCKPPITASAPPMELPGDEVLKSGCFLTSTSESPTSTADRRPDSSSALAAATLRTGTVITVSPVSRPATWATSSSVALGPPIMPMVAVLLPPCSSAGMIAPSATATRSSTEAIQNDLALARSLISRLVTSQVSFHHSLLTGPPPSASSCPGSSARSC